MDESDADPAIACNLDALSLIERTRRSELARTIQESAIAVDQTDWGYGVQLPNDSEICQRALELILLERRCCPFLSLGLEFPPSEGAVVLSIGGPPGVKEFLRDNGILGCAQSSLRPTCC